MKWNKKGVEWANQTTLAVTILCILLGMALLYFLYKKLNTGSP